MNFFTTAAAMVFSLGLAVISTPYASAGNGFWSPPPRTGACPGGRSPEAMPTTRAIQGWKPANPAIAFVDASGRNVGRAARTRGFDTKRFAQAYVQAARAGAFTALDFEGPGGPSPVFATSLVLIATGYATALFDQTGAWTPEERKAVMAWAAKLDKNQNAKRKYASPDSIAAIGAARMVLGAASGNRKLLAKGLADFKKTGRLMRKDHLFETNLRDNNEVVGLMVLAAEAAMRSGVDAYGMSLRGATLHAAVEAHARKTLAIGPKAIRESDNGHVGSYFTPNGFAAHVAWIPIYLKRFPNSHAAAEVRKLHAAVQRHKRGAYNGTSLGGPTSCLWGF